MSWALGGSVALAMLAGCTSATLEDLGPSTDITPKLAGEIKAKGFRQEDPMLVRIFKEESELEIWKRKPSGQYALFKSYPICRWSGKLGPKRKSGDRQAPEGFYNITPAQMNPNSSYYLSFDIGYPNKYDRAYGRSGRNIMVHGACASAGCYSISDAAVLQVYAFARDAFRGGQKSFQLQAYPFRMTAENMAKHRGSEYYSFWQNLKTGYDYFEITHRPPEVDVCNKQYAFNQVSGCNSGTPAALTAAYASYSKTYEAAFAVASKKYGSDWKDVAEWDRKAMERQARRRGKLPAIPNDANYVVVDPNAKNSPTSDAVATFAQAQAKIDAKMRGIQPSVEYISVAEIEYRKKLEEAKRKEDEKLEKRLAKARIPVPEANPMRPVMQAYAEEPKDSSEGSFWKTWERKLLKNPPAEVEAVDAAAEPLAQPKLQTESTDNKMLDKAAAKPAAQPPVVVEQKAETTLEQKPAEKPFWKLW